MGLERQTRVHRTVRQMWAKSHQVLNRLLDVTGNSRYWSSLYTPGTPEWELANQYAEARRLVDRIIANPEKTPNEIWDEALADYIRRTHEGQQR